MNEEKLKAAYADAVARRSIPGQPCEVSLEAMLQVLERRGSADERAQVLHKIMRHSACRQEFELLRAVHAADAEEQRARMLRRWGWAAAAVVVLAAGFTATQLMNRPEPLRGAGAEVVLLSPADQSTQPRSTGFVWLSIPGAVDYRLEIVDAGGVTVFSGMTSDTTMPALPDSLLAAGKQYRWLVTSLGSSGLTYRSPAWRFVIRE